MPLLSSSSGLSARALGLTGGVVAGPLTINSISGILNSTTGTQLSVSFSSGISGSSPITNYEFSLNNGSTFTPFSPAQTTSPLIISGLTNGTTSTVKIRSLQGNQSSQASNAVSGRPVALPGAPTISAITNDANGTTGGHISVAFAAGSAGTDATINYQYSIDDGVTFVSPSPVVTTSPLLITGLTNGTTHSIRLRALTSNSHNSSSSLAVSSRPVALPGAPTISAITASTGQISIAFTAGSAGTDAASTFQFSLNGGSTFTNRATGTTESPIVATGINDATVASGGYSVKVRQVTNQNHFSASSTAVVPVPTPAQAPVITDTSKTQTSITVTFTSAVAGSYAIDRHEQSLDGTNYATYISGNAINNLSPGTEYTIRIRAVDVQGVTGEISTTIVTTSEIPFTFSGGTSYDPGVGYQGVFFTMNGTFTILTGTRNIDYLIMSGGSGGGGGGNNTSVGNRGGGGGGAAGNFGTSTQSNASVGDFVITIGAGGSRGNYVSGSNSSLTYSGTAGSSGGATVIVYNGQTIDSQQGPGGGSPGIGRPQGADGGDGGSNNANSGGLGAIGSGSTSIIRAGGGGAGAAIGGSGGNASVNIKGASGGGLIPTIAPTILAIGKGGEGGGSTAGSTPANSGSGGGGVGNSGATPTGGRAGVVFLRWLT